MEIQVALGTYITAPNVNTQAIKSTHFASSHVHVVVGWWVLIGWLVGGDPSKWHRINKNGHLIGFAVGVFWPG